MSIIGEAFVSMLVDGLAALVEDEVTMLWGVKSEIKRLQDSLQTINDVLADAESKMVQRKAIGMWLKKLKDIMYDADDILDECRIKAEKSKAAVSSGCQPCSCFGKIVFAHQIGRRIKGLNRKLDDICAEKSKFDLQVSSADNSDHRSASRVSRKTSPVAEPDIVGSKIEEDTDKLVELLIKEDSRDNILVYAIVGTGGIGKTTLARKIFNEERIKTKFPIKLWVCVSKDFEETSLLKDVIAQAIPEGRLAGDPSRAELDTKVADTVTNKKFLLVLDDVWDPKVWNDLLRNPLQGGATGSSVLVTTRNHGVASRMKAVRPHHQVEVLSAADGWALLRKKVVLSREEGEIEDLVDIGEEIVVKCGGLPLAIKTIGGVLSMKSRTKTEWERVLKTLSSNAWSSLTDFPQEVQPALWLSYEDLPSHLKQCFLYYSLFPEDYIFNRDKLIYCWISEGFIHEEGDLTLEELGEDYYGELVQRSFLQPYPPLYGEFESTRCTVHDLLWSFARFLARDENLVVKDGVEVPINSSSLKPRRIRRYVTKENCQASIGALEGHKSLRTLLLCLAGSHVVQENDIDNLIKKTPCLRVLHVSGPQIIKLPDSLGNLIHLRYLDLSISGISELPESIENLVNLQFLILQSCDYLRNLPKGIGKLHNLQCLDLLGTELEGIPIEIANLHRLRRLAISNCDIRPQLPSLGKLPDLDYLSIDKAFAVKKIGTEFLGQKPDCSSDQVGRMQIFPKLTKLIFHDLPNWEEWEWDVKDDDRLIAVPKLQELALLDCPKLRSLPSSLVRMSLPLQSLI
ncbi:putative disease resistance protein RGA3 [Phoenix dactylifera]|uniref:Disease resistance protein RGA3 n=1 Tax=Phoenix dactylifera TaxID=42345 RepID=A0A8B7CH60_PHODC|nr:putative disease resistance protein RGA3 [Phoenix dactylifera]